MGDHSQDRAAKALEDIASVLVKLKTIGNVSLVMLAIVVGMKLAGH